MATVTKKPEAIDIYHKYKNEYKERAQEVKRQFISKQIDDSDNKTKAIWQAIRKELKGGKDINETSITIPPGDLNKFFCEIAENISQNIPGPKQQPKSYMTHNQSCSFYLSPVTTTEVTTIINELKDKATSDYYGMTMFLVKKVRDIIAEPLADAINHAFTIGVYPPELKIARVVPVHKSGDINCPTNYRPISILPLLSKIFETALKNRMVKYLEERNIISDAQHGYRTGRSTVTALTNTVEKIATALDNRNEAVI